MKLMFKITCLLVAVSCCEAIAQQQSLATSLEVYVFPAKGQAAEQQSQDESQCYQWAMNNTGVNPFKSSQDAVSAQQQAAQAQQQANQASQGAGIQGAARGAATGAIIGAIADDNAGKGAAYGAGAGAIIRRSRARRSRAAATTQAQSQSAQASAQSSDQILSFKKAFSACLQGNGYQVNY